MKDLYTENSETLAKKKLKTQINGKISHKDLTEAEEIKKRWQEYKEEIHKKSLNDPNNHDGIVTHLELDILECELKQALGSITTNKANGGDGIPAELFKILKDDGVKLLHSIWQQTWETSSDHRTGKSQFLFQSQRKAMPKNVPTIMQLCSFYILARLCSKSFKLGFSSTWTENLQIHKLGFEDAEEPEIKLPTFVGSWRKQGRFIKASISASLTLLKPVSVRITTHCGKQTWVLDHLTYLLRNLCAGQEATVKTRHGTTD